MEIVINILSLEFAQRAFLVGIMAAGVAGALGAFVVAGRQSVFSDMLAHTALAGVGLGLLFNIAPLWGAIAVAIVSAILLWFSNRKKEVASEAISMVLLSGGLALALVFSHLARDAAISLEAFLFGSILTIRPEEVWWFAVAGLAICIFLLLFGKRLETIVLDPAYAESRFLSSKWVELGFFLSVALLVGLSLKVVGGLLIGALLVIPAVTSQLISSSFRSTVIWTVFFNILAVTIGILVSFLLDVPAGAAIVLTLIVLLLGVFAGRRVFASP